MYLQLLLACLSYVAVIHSAPLELSIGEISHKVDARQWLFKYGYRSTYNPKLTEKQLQDSIKNMQRFAGLPESGKLDDVTLKQMAIPRCGQSDPIIKVKSRSRRYNHQGTDWLRLFRNNGKMELKWTLKNSGRSLRYDTVLVVMREAFRFWQAKTNIDFIEISYSDVQNNKYKEDDIEILVSFVNGYHDDPYAFDGEGGTLAHAFYPHSNKGLSGDVHFDDAERYTYKSPQGRNLLWVATHELGHSLGLEHSNVREAVMFPWYTKYKPGFKLHSDDVLGIQTLYGSRTKPMPGSKRTTTTTTRRPAVKKTNPTTTTQRPAPYTRKCPKFDSDITAIYYSKRYGQQIAFTNSNKMYLTGYRSRIPVLNRYKYLPQYRIPDQINAVVTTKVNGKERQVYFAGSKYYVYTDFKFVDGPHSIHDGRGPLRLRFPRSVKSIDAALKYQRNGRTYFFSGNYYWRYDTQNARFDAGYPRKISTGWKGLPSRVDAALSSTSDKKTFFIANNKYYVFDDNTFRVKAIHPITTLLECKTAARAVAGFSIGALVADNDDVLVKP